MCNDLLGSALRAITNDMETCLLPLYIVTNASVAAAAAWAAERALPRGVAVLCDEGRRAHAALGLHRSVARTFTFRRGWDNLKGLFAFPYEACVKGRLPGVNAGDPWQQAGVLVLRATGEAAFTHREESPGWPLLDAAALRAAAAAAAGAEKRARGGAARPRRR
jgi:hypothetical protein